jgi:adenosylhomocysteinase
MDLTFAIRALCAHHLANNSRTMDNRVHLFPKEIDDEVARIKLDAVGMGVDSLTPEQVGRSEASPRPSRSSLCWAGRR